MHNKINNQYVNNVQYCCRVPQGTCGLKCKNREYMVCYPRRVPQGTCGLKSQYPMFVINSNGSGPARDLWIEIVRPLPQSNKRTVGSRKGPVD